MGHLLLSAPPTPSVCRRLPTQTAPHLFLDRETPGIWVDFLVAWLRGGDVRGGTCHSRGVASISCSTSNVALSATVEV